jgi:hypothetical protein
MNDAQPHRKVYAKGFFDGMAAAGASLPSKEHMTPNRFNSIFNGLSSVAKKVLEAVPIEEKWTAKQINSELARTGRHINFAITEGCLNTLVESGLVKEPTKGAFSKICIKTREPAPPSTTEEIKVPSIASYTENPAQPAKKFASPIERLGVLAQRVTNIMGMLKELAGDIENAAIEIEEQNAANADEINKVRQLKQLLNQIH